MSIYKEVFKHHINMYIATLNKDYKRHLYITSSVHNISHCYTYRND